MNKIPTGPRRRFSKLLFDPATNTKHFAEESASAKIENKIYKFLSLLKFKK